MAWLGRERARSLRGHAGARGASELADCDEGTKTSAGGREAHGGARRRKKGAPVRARLEAGELRLRGYQLRDQRTYQKSGSTWFRFSFTSVLSATETGGASLKTLRTPTVIVLPAQPL